jgi:hypothetical protein
MSKLVGMISTILLLSSAWKYVRLQLKMLLHMHGATILLYPCSDELYEAIQ